MDEKRDDPDFSGVHLFNSLHMIHTLHIQYFIVVSKFIHAANTPIDKVFLGIRLNVWTRSKECRFITNRPCS